MRYHLLFLALPITLASCTFLWSSQPFSHWFSRGLQISEQGVGEVNAGTPLQAATLEAALGGKYHLQAGMGTYQGDNIAFYQASDHAGQPRVTLYGKYQGNVTVIDMRDKNVSTVWGVRIGTLFSEIYSQAFNACQKGSEVGFIQCLAPQSRHVSYLFQGAWNGPVELMPPDETLKSWIVSAIIWRTNIQ